MKTLSTVVLFQFSSYSKKKNWFFFLRGNVWNSEFQTDTVDTYVLLSGSTHILTPKGLLDEVKSLSKPKDVVCIKDE